MQANTVPGDHAAGLRSGAFVGSGWRRSLAHVRLGQRWLEGCLGARVGAWLARATTLGFAVAALALARPLPEAPAAVIKVALSWLSWCAGLAALSLAGPGPERGLAAGRGLLEQRGCSVRQARAERPLALARWTLAKLGLLALVVIVASLAGTSEAWRAARLVGLAAGALLYLGALGLGLGALAYACERLGSSHGQALLLGIVLLPELLSPAWPELPTVVGGYGWLLELCLGLGYHT